MSRFFLAGSDHAGEAEQWAAVSALAQVDARTRSAQRLIHPPSRIRLVA